MKHSHKESPSAHRSVNVQTHHGATAWVGIVAVLLTIIGVAAVYWIKKCRSSYRKKRRVARRAQSAAELNPTAISTANKRVSFRTRSASSEQSTDDLNSANSSSQNDSDKNSGEKINERTPLVTHRIDSLARLLFQRAIGGGSKGATGHQGQSTSQETNRHNVRYQYSALDATETSHERLELERRAREGAYTVCQRYICQSPRYELLRHLNDIGSRFEKHWFVVKDVSVKTDRLLSLVPICSVCPIACNQETRDVIIELFQNLQHPYIYPILDFEFTDTNSSNNETNDLHAVLVMPFNTEGSLKDLIYGSAWQDDWSHKYGRRSPGLPLPQIQRLGRQILEALLFLRERGFPPYGHLHSGNVILQNGVARLAGLENTLLGFTSRCHQVVWRRARSAPAFVDVICFGHVLFEMAAGYELNQPQPSPGHLQLDLDRCPQVVDVLELIFQQGIDNGSDSMIYHYPTIEELLMCDFFRNIDLREMRGMVAGSIRVNRLPHSVRTLLDEVRRPRRACASEPSSPLARDRRCHDDQIHRVFSSDDCTLSDDPSSSETIQHRELLYHLLNGTEQLLTPLFTLNDQEQEDESSGHDSQYILREQQQQLLAVR